MLLSLDHFLPTAKPCIHISLSLLSFTPFLAGWRLSVFSELWSWLWSRKGLGKVRHIEVNQLWIQDSVGSGDVELHKILGTVNPADALTKYIESEILIRHMHMTSQYVHAGRHDIMPNI